GRIVYYTQIPDAIDTSSFPPTDLNQRFWKDYIDYVLGLVQLSANSWEVTTGRDTARYGSTVGLTGYGGDFTWGTVQIKAKPHPNDYVSLIMFSVPQNSSNNPGNRFNRVRVPLGRDYQRLSDCLWYPLSTIENPGTTIGPYDYNNNLEVPRAMGGTCFSMPLML